MIKKIIAIAAITIILPIYAHAEFIRADSIDEYIDITTSLINESDSDLQNVFSISGYDKFESCRLLLLSDSEISYSAADKIISSPDGQYMMFFKDPAETKQAYDYYTAQGVNVIPDVLFYVDDTADVSLFPEHISYGPEFIHADEFNRILLNKYGSVENMPEINIGVIDTGVNYNHELLRGRVDLSSGYDFANNDNDPLDDHGHGSHVSGIIADTTLSNVTIVPYKTITSTGRGSVSLTVNAINKAISDGNIDILNMSLTSDDEDLAIRNYLTPYLKRAYESGILSVAAAGNSHSNAAYSCPANVSEYTVAVSSCDKTGAFASGYSNYGSIVEFCAPGSSIYSSVHTGPTSYSYKSGTSMSAPFASAAFAMLNTYFPDYSNTELEQAMIENAIDAGEAGKDEYFGYGYISMENFIKMYGPAPGPADTAEPSPDQLIININGNETLINSSSGSATVISALYSDSGELSSLKFYDITESCNITTDDFSKIFIFESPESLKPLHNAILK